MSIEAMKIALEALETAPLDHNSIKSRFFERRHHAIAALRQAIKQAEQAQPVAYMSLCFSKGQTKPNSKTLFFPEQYTGRTDPVSVGAWGEEHVVPLYAVPSKSALMDEIEALRAERDAEHALRMRLIEAIDAARGMA